MAIQDIDPTLRCETAESGLEALHMLRAMDKLPDLIFLDLNMPIMNGKQFLTEAKKDVQLKDIPVIILSTSSDLTTKSETIQLGASDFITKPNKLSLLESRLRSIFQ